MRVLFTTRLGPGNLHPLVRLARALRDAGHAIAFGPRPRQVASSG